MSKAELLQLLASNKRFFVLLFCVLFGVIASESYLMLKYNTGVSFRKILPKMIVALFVCSLCTPLIDYFHIDDKVYPYLIMFASCVSMPLLEWAINDMLPSMLSGFKTVLINILTKGKNKKDDDNDLP